MTILCVCLITVIVVLGFALYLALGMFRVSVLDRRDHRQQDPDVSVILQAVYPIRESIKSLPARMLIGSRTCEKIRALNEELEKLAGRQNVTYLDLTDILSNLPFRHNGAAASRHQRDQNRS